MAEALELTQLMQDSDRQSLTGCGDCKEEEASGVAASPRGDTGSPFVTKQPCHQRDGHCCCDCSGCCFNAPSKCGEGIQRAPTSNSGQDVDLQAALEALRLSSTERFHSLDSEVRALQNRIHKQLEKSIAPLMTRLAYLEGKRLPPIEESAFSTARSDLRSLVSHEVAKQLEVLASDFRVEVSTAAKLAWDDGFKRLQDTLSTQVSRHSAVAERAIESTQTSTKMSIERLHKALQEQVTSLRSDVQDCKSQVAALERPRYRPLQAAQQRVSVDINPQSPARRLQLSEGSLTTVFDSPRTTPRSLTTVFDSGTLVPPSYSRMPTETRTETRWSVAAVPHTQSPSERLLLEGLHQRLAGRVSGIVSVLDGSVSPPRSTLQPQFS